jgi:hypothetical protein
MRDINLLVTDAAVAADAFSANAISLDGTPAEGIWLEFTILRNHTDADEVLDITVYGKNTNAAWAIDDTVTPVGVLKQIVHADVANAATITRYLLVQTKLNYLKPYYNVGGTTPSWTVTCSVVSGPDQKQTAAGAA